jgi:hypothetical protein
MQHNQSQVSTCTEQAENLLPQRVVQASRSQTEGDGDDYYANNVVLNQRPHQTGRNVVEKVHQRGAGYRGRFTGRQRAVTAWSDRICCRKANRDCDHRVQSQEEEHPSSNLPINPGT